jgi:hypothetical protein
MTTDLTIPAQAVDFNDFVESFQSYLNNVDVWKGTLTTQTSQTLVELVAAVGTFMEGRNIRTGDDAFSETAQSDSAIRSITQMQGLRMTRKLPCGLPVTMTSSLGVAQTLDPMTQFMIGGQYYFNRDQIFLDPNTPLNTTLYQGRILAFGMSGLGSPRQTFLTNDDEFTVSDQDVRVFINNTMIPKSFGTLWNYKNLPAYADLTTSDGRCLIVFGSELYGYTPLVTDTVIIQYAITSGADGANVTLVNKPLTVDGHPEITGKATANPTGGGDEQPIQTYKNLSSGAFGTYSSAVTKSQYLATIGTYPGIVDSVTQAQRDINPMALEWMNVIRISALTTTTWTQAQQQDYIKYLQSVTMYSTRFVWQDAIPVFRDIEVTVYCFNTAVLTKVQADCETQIQKLFAPRAGLLMTNFYNYDLENACRLAGKGAVSYVTVQNPVDPMIVTVPPSPNTEYEIITGAGTLGQLMYAYGVSVVNADGEEGPPANWVFPQVTKAMGPNNTIKITWLPLQVAAQYKIYGRKANEVGLLGTVTPGPGVVLEFIDDGSIVPGVKPPGTADVPIRYNKIASLKVNVQFAERQQRIQDTPTRLA